MRLRLLEQHGINSETNELRKNLQEGWQDIKYVPHHHNFLYIPDIIYFEIISCHHNNLLASHFRIEKTREMIAKKYIWPTLC